MNIGTSPSLHVSVDALDAFVRGVLAGIGAGEATVDAVARVMMHGSLFGVDSHGVRLLPHYVKVMVGGRINIEPQLKYQSELAAVAVLDADDGHGALAAYSAMDKAVSLASTYGVGCVSIRNSSHFGAAGAFVLEAARQGMIGFATCNSDALVRLHDGAERFHGTNPLAWAVPGGARPWFFDMATSAIPFNRVLLYRSLGWTLPHGTASDGAGIDTKDAESAEMLAPLGEDFGFKGAGLAGVAEIFSAVLSGMRLSTELMPMMGQDISTPRKLGAFVMALNPAAFGSRDEFDAGMIRYLNALRRSETREGGTVLAPGDREWALADNRHSHGVPLDPATIEAFTRLARTHGLPPLDPIRATTR